MIFDIPILLLIFKCLYAIESTKSDDDKAAKPNDSESAKSDENKDEEQEERLPPKMIFTGSNMNIHNKNDEEGSEEGCMKGGDLRPTPPNQKYKYILNEQGQVDDEEKRRKRQEAEERADQQERERQRLHTKCRQELNRAQSMELPNYENSSTNDKHDETSGGDESSVMNTGGARGFEEEKRKKESKKM